MSEEKMGTPGRGWMGKVRDQCVYSKCRNRATFTYGYGFSYCDNHVDGKGEMLGTTQKATKISVTKV